MNPTGSLLRIDVSRVLIAILTVMCVFSAHLAEAQWTVNGGYAVLTAAPQTTIGAGVERRVDRLKLADIHLRLLGEYGTDRYRDMYVQTHTRVLRGGVALTLQRQFGWLHASTGAIGGLERFDRSVPWQNPDVIPDRAAPRETNRIVPFVGGLVELGIDLPGPVKPVFSIRREYVFHERGASRYLPDLYNLRRNLSALSVGIEVEV